MRLVDQLGHRSQPGNDALDVRLRRGRCPAAHLQRLLPQDAQHSSGIVAPDAVPLQDRRNRRLADLRCLRRRRRLLPQLQDPAGSQISAQLQHLRVVAAQLLAHAIDQPVAVLLKLLPHARPFPQLDQLRLLHLQMSKTAPIGAQRVRQHPRVAPVVLGPGRRKPVPKSIQLLGIDRVHLHLALQQHLHHRSMRHFDRRVHALQVLAGQFVQPRAQVGDAVAAVRHLALPDYLAVSFQHADLMLFGRPVDSHEPLFG